jgi:transposase-like protein
MPGKRMTPEQIIGVLRQAEVELAQGRTVGEVCRGLGVSEASFYRWRTEYGGLKVDQARRMKELERENARLKRAVAELTLDKQILREAAEGKYQAPSAAGPVSAMSKAHSASRNAGRAAPLVSRARRSAACAASGTTRRR